MASYRLIAALSTVLLMVRGPDTPSWAPQYQRAIQSLNHGEFESARKIAERGYRTWRGQPQSHAYWSFRLALAESLVELKRNGDAFPLLDSPAPTRDDDARRLADLAMVHFYGRRNDLASQYLERAREGVPAGSRELHGKIDLIEGMFELGHDRLAQAEETLRRAYAEVEGSRSLIESYTLSDLGYVDLRRFRYDEALYWFLRARDLAQENGLQRALEVALCNLGAAYLNLGDTDLAAQNLERGLAIGEKLKDRFYQMPMFVLLGETYSASGQLTKAADCYRRARALGEPSRDKLWLSNVLNDLSAVELKRGDIDAAQDLNRQGLALARQLNRTDALRPQQLQSAEIEVARRDYPNAEKLFTAALESSRDSEDPAVMFQSHAGLASLYRDTGAAGKAEAEFRAGADLIDSERAKLQLDESKFSFLSKLIDFYRDYVDFLMESGDSAGAFRVAESCRARVLEEKLERVGATVPADLAALEKAARNSGSVLLSYWLTPRFSRLWVIDAAGLHAFTLPQEAQIAAHVQVYDEAIQQGTATAGGYDAGRWLATNLLTAHYDPAKGSKLVIEPDGILHRLNFESLPGADGQFLAADVTISVAPSLSVLRRYDSVPLRRLLAFGDPGFQGTEYSQLSNLKAELASVESHFADKTVYVAAAATPAAYRTAHAEAYSTLHFATHAVANRESPLDSAIILAGPAESRKLYARDILRQPLTADLVTLSACQTAGSRTYHGEGLTGFSWAFLSAGAHNVVAGLWDVDDRATARLMKSFYDELAKGETPASALRNAKLGMIAGGGVYAKPLYWAAFETFTKALYEQ